MNYAQTTGRTIQQDFEAFDKKHPQVYDKFVDFARVIVKHQMEQGIQKKDIRTSSKLIINRIRWEIMTGNIKPGQDSEKNASNGIYDDFKINDAFTSRYARKFAEMNPDWAHIFPVRKLRS